MHSLKLFTLEHFSARKGFTSHANVQVLSINRVFLYKLHHPPRYSGNLADYSRQFHDDDRDTWSQSQNEEGPLVYPFKVTSAGFWHNLPH